MQEFLKYLPYINSFIVIAFIVVHWLQFSRITKSFDRVEKAILELPTKIFKVKDASNPSGISTKI